MTHVLLGLGAPTVLLLEGGYNLDMTARSVSSCLEVLQGAAPQLPEESHEMSHAGARGVRAALRAQRPHWPSLASQAELLCPSTEPEARGAAAAPAHS